MVIDIVVAILVLGYATLSYVRGLLLKLAGIAALIVASLGAKLLGQLIAHWAAARWNIQTMTILYVVCTLVAWVVLFIIGLLVLRRLAKWLGSTKEGKPAAWNKLLGGLLGVAEMLLLCWFLLAIVDAVPEDYRARYIGPLHREMEASWFCLAVHATNPAARLELQPLIDDASAIAAQPAALKSLQDEEVVRKLSRHPKIEEILADRKLLEEFRAGKLRRFFSDRRVRDALEDSEIRAILREADLRDTLRRLAAEAREMDG